MGREVEERVLAATACGEPTNIAAVIGDVLAARGLSDDELFELSANTAVLMGQIGKLRKELVSRSEYPEAPKVIDLAEVRAARRAMSEIR